MRNVALLFCFIVLSIPAVLAQEEYLFDDTHVSEIYIALPQDSLQVMIDNLENDRYTQARFIFKDGTHTDTVQQVGLRLRGNTSLSSQKKSFKISFNEFVPGREYQGVRKLNLLGLHNDPTMIREKLYYEVWAKTGMLERRTSFVKVFINGEYRGLYTNSEELDKQWLKRMYDDPDGNLYKCTYPANLAFLGPDVEPYKAIMNNPEERAYDLKTNEEYDDYTRLVLLIWYINLPITADYKDNLSQVLNVRSVLMAYATDVATGNWDDYFYNKNNYFLYDNPTTGRFDFMPYDTDNTFGVDWLNKDWATRNCLSWQPSSDPRPLATKLLAVPEFKAEFVHYLDSITRYITHPDSIFPRIDLLHNQITPAAVSDNYRTLDYGYTIADFHNGFTQTIDGHTPYGIKPFLETRRTNTLSQIAGLVGNDDVSSPTQHIRIMPNPTTDWLYVYHTNPSDRPIEMDIYDLGGKKMHSIQLPPGNEQASIDLSMLPPGSYMVRFSSEKVYETHLLQVLSH